MMMMMMITNEKDDQKFKNTSAVIDVKQKILFLVNNSLQEHNSIENKLQNDRYSTYLIMN